VLGSDFTQVTEPTRVSS